MSRTSIYLESEARIVPAVVRRAVIMDRLAAVLLAED